MPKTFTHLTQDQRYQIYDDFKDGFSQREMALLLGKSQSTISREMRRNAGQKGYRPQQAQKRAEQRQYNKPKRIKMTADMQSLISQKLREEWSPEQICGRLRSEEKETVCPATIYKLIRQDKASGGDLNQHLRHPKPYKQRTGKPEARGQIIGRVGIEHRPEIVDAKTRLGDWEADTVIGKGHRGVLVTLTERFSRKNLIASVPSKHAAVVKDAIIDLLIFEKTNVHTITFDNGKEFAYHAAIKEELGCDNYFAHPYSSWERGLNENHNGLIRQYLPKQMAWRILVANASPLYYAANFIAS